MDHINEQELHSCQEIVHLRPILQGFIIQCEVHAQTKLCLFCPLQPLPTWSWPDQKSLPWIFPPTFFKTQSRRTRKEKSDDISGVFYTSVPHDTIITSFQHMIQTFAFPINYSLAAKSPRTIQWKTFTSKSVAKIWLQNIIPRVQLSLQTSVFVSLYMQKTTFESTMTTLFPEKICRQLTTCNTTRRLQTETVENTSRPDVRRLASWTRTRTGNGFLGFTINKTNAYVQNITPDQAWQFRSEKSAETSIELVTRLVSCIYLIIRHTYPKFLITPSVQQLFDT